MARVPMRRWRLSLFALALIAFVSPALAESDAAARGLYAENCAACHGPNAGGTKKGPPLIHRLYEPSHHPDAAFRRAAKNGVQAHHWGFGNMPRVGVADDELTNIIAYVRQLQRANGIQ